MLSVAWLAATSVDSLVGRIFNPSREARASPTLLLDLFQGKGTGISPISRKVIICPVVLLYTFCVYLLATK
jgi:hypothetical protein